MSRTALTRRASESVQPTFGLSIASAPPDTVGSRPIADAAQSLGMGSNDIDDAVRRLDDEVRRVDPVWRDEREVIREACTAPTGDRHAQPGVGVAGASGGRRNLGLRLGRDEEQRSVIRAENLLTAWPRCGARWCPEFTE